MDNTGEQLREQLIRDMDRLHGLIVRVARGDRSAKAERDRLEGVVQIKMALWQGIEWRRLSP